MGGKKEHSSYIFNMLAFGASEDEQILITLTSLGPLSAGLDNQGNQNKALFPAAAAFSFASLS